MFVYEVWHAVFKNHITLCMVSSAHENKTKKSWQLIANLLFLMHKNDMEHA